MVWETHPAKVSFARFADDWDRLNADLYASHPFYDSRFVGPLLEHFADGRELLCLDRRDGVVGGALIVKANGIGRWSIFRPSQTQASALLIRDALQLESLFKALPGLAWTIELHAIDPRYAPDFLGCGLPHIAHPHARTIGINHTLKFDDYWAQRPKNLKANVRRYFNRAEKESATPQLAIVDEHGAMNAGVARFGELETAGWKGAAGTAVSKDNKQGEFYADVLARFALAAQAVVYELYVGGQLASSRLLISSEQMAIILKTTYDESLARFAPGRILLYHVIQQELLSPPRRTIEFYTNATRDQAEWASFACTIANIQLFRNDACAATFSVLKSIRRRFKRATGRKAATENDLLIPTVKTLHSLDGAAAVDLDLAAFSRHDSLETSLDWFELLRKTVFPDDPGVRYYCAKDHNRITTILPLRLMREGCVRTVESLSNFYSYLYAPIVSPDTDLLALNPLIAAATRDHGGAHIMRFSPMDPQSLVYAALLRALRANDWIPLPYFCFGNWFHPVEDSWEAYLKRRGRNLRSSIKRRSSRFAAAGGTIEIVSAPEQVDMAIAAFQEIYTASWKRPEPYAQFIPSLITLLAARGMLRLGIARLGDRTIAAQLWIVADGKASIFKVAYHRDFAAYSPGTVLTAHLFQHAIEHDRVQEIDFLIGDDKYKRIWMSDRRERWGIVAYNPRTMIGLALLIREASWRVVKSVSERLRGARADTRRPPTHPPKKK